MSTFALKATIGGQSATYSGTCLSQGWSRIAGFIQDAADNIMGSNKVSYTSGNGDTSRRLIKGFVAVYGSRPGDKLKCYHDVFSAVEAKFSINNPCKPSTKVALRTWTEQGFKHFGIPLSKRHWDTHDYYANTEMSFDAAGKAWYEYVRMCWYRMPSLSHDLINDFHKAFIRTKNFWVSYMYSRSKNLKYISTDYRLFPKENLSSLENHIGISSSFIMNSFELQDVKPVIGLVLMLKAEKKGIDLDFSAFNRSIIYIDGSFYLHEACRKAFDLYFTEPKKLFVRGGKHIFKSGLTKALRMEKLSQLKEFSKSRRCRIFTLKQMADSGLKCLNYAP